MAFGRFWEIDLLRGIAVVLMVAFHATFDLNYFYNLPIDVYSGFWLFLARLTASIFIFLVGVCLTISYRRAREKKTESELLLKYLKRGGTILFFGMLITFFTAIFFQEGTIWFGILHFIGISIILAYPFISFRQLNVFFGLVTIVLDLFVGNV